MNLLDLIAVVLVVIGVAFCGVAALGVLRLPDLYTRMQSATKAGTLGVACSALAAGFHLGTPHALALGVLIVLFVCATAPIATHLIARAAYASGVPLWERTTRDELREAMQSGAGDEERPGDEGPAA